MAKEKTTGFYFKMSQQEWDWVEQRMAQTGIRNKSAFIRKMAIDSHVINLDSTTINEIGKLLRVTANNVNQIARRVNSGGHAYREDIAHVDSQLTKIRADFGKALSFLSEIADGKPGKQFMTPIRISDLTEQITETAQLAEVN
ncbi:hypothetical protein FACS1894219_02920 [Clostridia bacterium]|nr:hypothetical protein FACS1894219_02920 [Clostridia bacterium]